MKIVILADSLALARTESEGNTPFEATYPYLLHHRLTKRCGLQAPFIIERGVRARTIEKVVEDWVEQVELKLPEIVIIQTGVVDCAPRVFLRRERAFIESIRWKRLRDLILRLVHKHRRRIVMFRQIVFVPKDRYRRLVEEVVERARSCKVGSLLFVNTISPPQSIENRSPGFKRNVQAYNEILDSFADRGMVGIVDMDTMVRKNGGPEALTVDGIHLNARCHQLLAEELERLTMDFIDKQKPAAPNSVRRSII